MDREVGIWAQKNGINCHCTAGIRNYSVRSTWSHILPENIESSILLFQGAPDIIISKLGTFAVIVLFVIQREKRREGQIMAMMTIDSPVVGYKLHTKCTHWHQ